MPDYRYISLDPAQDLDSWGLAEERPTGSRPKVTLIRSTDDQYFVFKRPKVRREHQIWSELLGSYIAGDLLGWDVQHVGLGVHRGDPGNLLRYIYDPRQHEEFIEGSNVCRQADPEFDVEKGHRHTLPLILRTYEEVVGPVYGLSKVSFLTFWSRAVALDTLISNGDRHAENWALVKSGQGTRMAALYDHGSSLGCEVDAVGLDRWFDVSGGLDGGRLARYRASGRHHIRLDAPAAKGAPYDVLSLRLLDEFPAGRAAFEQVADLDPSAVRLLLEDIVERALLPAPHALTKGRAGHIAAILQLGLERIRGIVGRRGTP